MKWGLREGNESRRDGDSGWRAAAGCRRAVLALAGLALAAGCRAPDVKGFIAHFDSDGKLTMAAQAGWFGNEASSLYGSPGPLVVAADSTGSLVVSGGGGFTADVPTHLGEGKTFLARFSPAGQLVWVRHTGFQGGFALLPDDTIVGVDDVEMLRLRPDGTPIWTRSSPSLFSGRLAAAGPERIVFVSSTPSEFICPEWIETASGKSAMTGSCDMMHPEGEPQVDAAGSLFLLERDAAQTRHLVKRASSGEKVWSTPFASLEANATLELESLALDPAGRPIVTGNILSGAIRFPDVTLTPTAGDFQGDHFVVRFDLDGKVLGTTRWPGRLLSVAPSGALFSLSRGYGDGADYRTTPTLVTRRGADGQPLWTAGADEADLIYASALRADAGGGVSVVGVYHGTARFGAVTLP